MINVYQRGGHTMGDSLIAMTMYNSLNQPVHITTKTDSWYYTWKRIFDIGEQITLSTSNDCPEWHNPPHPKFLESFKLFNRYDQFDHIKLFGQNFPIGRRGKKCVAVLINNGEHVKDEEFAKQLIERPLEYPFYKFHTQSTYDIILKLVQSAGYDPIIVDSKHTSAENKVFILNELCDFVIGYEGGMCHVAHSLKIPVIMLPLRIPNSFTNDFLHLDRRTYFINRLQEIENWYVKDLLDLVDALYNEELGNNYWLAKTNQSEIIAHFRQSTEQFSAQMDWVLQYTDNPRLGGF